MVEAAHGVNFGGGKLAGDEPRECEGDVGGVFTADEDGVGAVELVIGDGEAFAGLETPGVEGADEFVLAVAEIAGDDEAEILILPNTIIARRQNICTTDTISHISR